MKLDVLNESYIPKKVLHRNEQIKRIEELFEKDLKELIRPTTIILQGVTGSGKTVTVTHILKKYAGKYFYGKGTDEDKTTFRVLKQMLIQEKEYHEIGNDSGNAVGLIIKKMKEKPRVLIVDEVHKIKDLENFFQFLNGLWRAVSVPIIVITNNLMIEKKIPRDVSLTLFPKELFFPAYEANQIGDILKERLKEGRLEMNEEELNYVSAMGAKEGSARLTLRLTREYFLNPSNDVKKMYSDLNKKEWTKIISNLCPVEKRFLNALNDLSGNGNGIKTSDIQRSMGNLTKGRMSQIISNLKNYGLIYTQQVNLGRKGGMFNYIHFMNKEIKKILDDVFFSGPQYLI